MMDKNLVNRLRNLATILLCLAIICSTSRGQDFQWIQQFGGSENDGANCIKADNKGNVFVLGDFSGQAWGNTLSLQGVGFLNVFLAKYDDSGALSWVKQVKSQGVIRSRGLTIDSDGNICITGWIRDTTYFDTTMLVGPPKDSLYADYFIARYNPGGDLLWAKQAVTTYSNLGNSVTADSGFADIWNHF